MAKAYATASQDWCTLVEVSAELAARVDPDAVASQHANAIVTCCVWSQLQGCILMQSRRSACEELLT